MCFLLGQQHWCTKYPCFLCMWYSRAREKHWIKTNWPRRSNLKPGDPKILHEPLVDRKKIIFPPLHIRLGLLKQFVKAFPTDGNCFKSIILRFSGLSIEKIKGNVFGGPKIWQLIKYEQFTSTMSDLEKNAWLSFKDFVNNCLGNNCASNYTEIIQKLLESYKVRSCNMSIKLHYLHCHLANLQENLGGVSNKPGERFLRYLKVVEDRYEGR